MSKRQYILETYEDDRGWYRWRLKRGGKIIADSASEYVTKATLRRAVASLANNLFSGSVIFRGIVEG